jgi:hypothetical protein
MENQFELFLRNLISAHKFAMRHERSTLDSLRHQYKSGSIIAERLDSLPVLAKEQVHMALIHNRLHLMDTQTVETLKTTTHIDRLAIHEYPEPFPL